MDRAGREDEGRDRLPVARRAYRVAKPAGKRGIGRRVMWVALGLWVCLAVGTIAFLSTLVGTKPQQGRERVKTPDELAWEETLAIAEDAKRKTAEYERKQREEERRTGKPRRSGGKPRDDYLEVGTLKEETFVATDWASYNLMLKYARVDDEHGFRELIQAGRMMVVSAGTKVKVIDRGFFAHAIRILEGPHTGSSGVVAVEFVED